jgi:DNA-binding SARP family transcriptional activator
MRAYLLEGNRSEAIRHFREYSRLIREELGLDPAISFDELAKEVTAR